MIEGNLHQLHTTIKRLLATGRSEAPATTPLKSALGKIGVAMKIASGGGSLEDVLGEILQLQGKQTAQQAQLAKGRIQDRFRAIKSGIHKQLKEIQKRIDASKRSGFWGALIKVFQVIGSALSAVAGVLTGNPLMLAGAGLAFASVVTGLISDNPVMQAFSMGLGIAGALCSIGSLFTSAANTTKLSDVADTVRLCSKIGSTAASGLGSAAMVPKSVFDSEAGHAEASLLELRATGKRMLKEAAQDRELIRTLLDAQDRMISLVFKATDGRHRAQQRAAIGGR